MRIGDSECADTYPNLNFDSAIIPNLLGALNSDPTLALPCSSATAPDSLQDVGDDQIGMKYHCASDSKRILIVCSSGDLEVHRTRKYSGSRGCTPKKSECRAMIANQIAIERVARSQADSPAPALVALDPTKGNSMLNFVRRHLGGKPVPTRTVPAVAASRPVSMGILQIQNDMCRVLLLGVTTLRHYSLVDSLRERYTACLSPSAAGPMHSVISATLRHDSGAALEERYRVDCVGGLNGGAPIGSYWVADPRNVQNGPFTVSETSLPQSREIRVDFADAAGLHPPGSIGARVGNICINLEKLHKAVTRDGIAANTDSLGVLPSPAHTGDHLTYLKAGDIRSLTSFEFAPSQLLESIARDTAAGTAPTINDGVFTPAGVPLVLVNSDCKSKYVLPDGYATPPIIGDLTLALAVRGVSACVAPRPNLDLSAIWGSRLLMIENQRPRFYCLSTPIDDAAPTVIGATFVDQWELTGRPNVITPVDGMTDEAKRLCSGMHWQYRQALEAARDPHNVGVRGRSDALFADPPVRPILPLDVGFTPVDTCLGQAPDAIHRLTYTFNNAWLWNRERRGRTYVAPGSLETIWVTDRTLEIDGWVDSRRPRLSIEAGVSGVFGLLTAQSAPLFFQLYTEAFGHQHITSLDKNDRASEFIRGNWGYGVTDNGLGVKVLQEIPTGLMFTALLTGTAEGTCKVKKHGEFLANRMKQIWFILDQLRRYPIGYVDTVLEKTQYRQATAAADATAGFLRIRPSANCADTYWNIELGDKTIPDLHTAIQSTPILAEPCAAPTDDAGDTTGIALTFYCSERKNRILIVCIKGDVEIHRTRKYSGTTCKAPTETECAAMMANRLVIQELAVRPISIAPPPVVPKPTGLFEGLLGGLLPKKVARSTAPMASSPTGASGAAQGSSLGAAGGANTPTGPRSPSSSPHASPTGTRSNRRASRPVAGVGKAFPTSVEMTTFNTKSGHRGRSSSPSASHGSATPPFNAASPVPAASVSPSSPLGGSVSLGSVGVLTIHGAGGDTGDVSGTPVQGASRSSSAGGASASGAGTPRRRPFSIGSGAPAVGSLGLVDIATSDDGTPSLAHSGGDLVPALLTGR